MLFLEDHIKCVQGALEARRETCDAMVGLMSATEIVRMTRMGAYRMDKPATGLMAQIKKLRGAGKPGASAGEKQMKMLRRLPKLLKFIPGAAQDVRAYFLTLQYWLAGSDDNVVQMVRALVDRYAAGPRAALKGATRAAAPQDYPEVGVYHPALPARMSEDLAALPAPQAPVATVGLLLLRSYVLGKDAAHYDGVIAAFEARGVRVIPAFASGLDARPAIDKFFMADGHPTIDALVSLTGFSLVGGPAYNDSLAAEDVLAKLDVPYLAAHPLEFQTLQQWGASRQGLLPIESTIMVALPELDGATGPHVFGGRSDGSGAACTGCALTCTFPVGGLVREMRSCPERAESIAAKVLRLAKLRRTERAARKIAIVLFNFPPNAGATGSAAFLGVFESLFNTLGALARAGYAVDLPASVDDLRDAIIKGNAERFGADANVHARIAADDIVAREPHLAAIEAAWGAAPGRQQSDGRSVFILGAEFGNVLVGIQPAFGYEGDPMKLLFEGQFAPTHAFSTFYRWLREDYAAHAVLHFGTHGALEFMPGKQAGLTADCWPERLIGDLPNIYLYAANNPSEGAIAKRRSGATLVSYMTPPVGEAGLYKGLLDLKASIERWRATEPEAQDERDLLAPVIAAQAEAMDLDGSDVATLASRLYEIEATMIPHGLHIVGQILSAAERGEMLDSMPPMDLAERARLDAMMACEYELPALIHALDGGYIRPVAGGDILRSPEIMPTGRNVHGFDPFRLPSNFAVADGAAQAARLIARHVEDSGAIPESVAMVLWGTDNLKSEGAQIAQALALMGARPRFDSYGRLAGAELMTLAELGRPRIDVVATLSGIFRDLLPLQTRMLAEAAWLASEADEPESLNFVRKHSLAHMAAHGCDLETASLARLFERRRGLRRERQSDDRLGRLDRSRRACRRVRGQEGLRLWPDGRAGAPRRAAREQPRVGRPRLPEPRIARTRYHHRRPVCRHARRHQSRSRQGQGRRAAAGLYRRPDARRGQGALARRAGGARNADADAQSGLVRADARPRLRGRAQHRGAGDGDARLVGDDGAGRSVGLSADQRDLRPRRRDARAHLGAQSQGIGARRQSPPRSVRARPVAARCRDARGAARGTRRSRRPARRRDGDGGVRK